MMATRQLCAGLPRCLRINLLIWGDHYALHRNDLASAIRSRLATFRSYCRLHPPQMQILYPVQRPAIQIQDDSHERHREWFTGSTNPANKSLFKDGNTPSREGRPWANPTYFLTGANPFILKTEKLLEISALIKKYLPSVTSIGCFARITDSINKTDDDLALLRNAGYNGLTIGVETGDDNALAFMRKGYTSQNILTQCKRLEQAGIEYGFFYLTSISGKGKGEVGAKASANIFNQLHPFLIGPNRLTIYPESELYQELQMLFNSEGVYQMIKRTYWIHLTKSFQRSVKKIYVITEKISGIYDRLYLGIHLSNLK